MGSWCSELTPPAILLDHPGITAQEYASLLKTSGKENSNDPYLLPERLNLPHTDSYIRFKKPRTDIGLSLSPSLETRQDGSIKLGIGVELKPQKKYKLTLPENTEPGDIVLLDERDMYCLGLINNILSKTLSKTPVVDTVDSGDGIDTDSGIQFFDYEVEGQEFSFISKKFKSSDKLFRQHPQLKPENVYDFSVIQGCFHHPTNSFARLENFKWKCVDGRYYLDEETFNHIPEGGRSRFFDCGYTDLILTAEIIKRKQWNFLDIESTSESKESFLRRFPSSKKRVEKAVWDAQTSMFAKEHDLTNLEFMHRRLEYNLR